jgi:nitroimidazol reductase NimA-like FMN-containing flavoprotein (pyridoxamine 5'-phosphate oxidase superfamily)
MDETQLHAVLATAGDEGPHASLVAFAMTPDLRHLLFASPRKTRKYRNLLRTPGVALLVDTRTNTPDDYRGAEAVTLTGTARPVRRGSKRDRLSAVFLAKHPRLGGFLDESATALVAVRLEGVMQVRRFQDVRFWRLSD